MAELRGKRRGLLSLGAILMAVGIVIVFATTAGAVHNLGVFELESGTLGANAVTDHAGTGLPDDWDRVEAGTDNADAGSTFQTDAANATIFTGGGSKDDHDVSDWKWKNGSAPDKDELLHAFAARYSHLGDSLLYFGADRFDNSGDAQIGFWFLQDDIAATGTPGGGGIPFASEDGVAEHIVGDLLILSDFTGGGTDSHIRVFMWDPGFVGAIDGVLRPLGGSENVSATCGSNANDDFCANVNRPTGTNLTEAPWDFLDKSGHTDFAVSELYEGGVNLSNLPVDLSDQCFASIVVETRSSSSVDAVLKDFVADSFQPCESGIVTTPQNSSVTVGSTNRDLATVTGTGGGTPTGTVQFFICSPSQTVLNNGNPTCPDGNGTQVGTPVEGEDLTPVNSTTATAISDPTTALNTPGTWCFRGEYVPAVGSPYDPATDDLTTECFQVVTVPSNISTSQSVYPNDSATITIPSGAGGTPTGSVKFRLYDSVANCQATTPSDTVGQGGLLFKQTINLPGTAPFTVTTTNTAAAVSANSTVAWLVEFDSTNPAQDDRKSVCVERTALTFTNDAGPGTP